MTIVAKILLLGDGAVGKTSLRNQFLGKSFKTTYLPTLGADYAVKAMPFTVSGNEFNLKFQIWDLAGQPAFGVIRSLYYKRAVGAFLVFDVTNPKSLENLLGWRDELIIHTGSPKIATFVLGNKIDLTEDISDTISKDQAEGFITKKLSQNFPYLVGPLTYFETSALTGLNVNLVFQALGERIMNQILISELSQDGDV